MSDIHFTPTQGRYLAFIHAYTCLHGIPPAETEIAAAMCVSAPSVNQMVKSLERRGLISREPGQPRTIQVLVPDEEIPRWNNRKLPKSPKHPPQWVLPREERSHESSPSSLYVLSVSLTGGPVSEKFAGKVIKRVIEIRGDQTLDDLHEAIFKAYDRWDSHLYEFQFGKRPFDPEGPNYGIPDPTAGESGCRDARTTTLDELQLDPERVFGYWFDFGDDWFHEIQVERIERAIPTARYPRVTKRIGKSPPQYREDL